MTRRRSTHRGLTESRIYPKNLRFYLFTAEPTVNPADGKARKWHSLCKISEGELRARSLARVILDYNNNAQGAGNFTSCYRRYQSDLLAKKEATASKEPARIQMHLEQMKILRGIGEAIIDAFADFNVDQVLPVDIAAFVDQWAGRRMAQVYHSRLSDFFRWCCRRGYCVDNPVRDVSVEKPKSRSRYITDAEYHQIRAALLVGNNGLPTISGRMVQCYVDLCYLLYQRTTEIRLLRWTDIDEEGGVIHFKPTKTERSSGASVMIPITPAIREVLATARGAAFRVSLFVIHNQQGEPYTAHGIGTAWKRACARAGVVDATMKDLRAKALTDAKRAGYNIEQISIGAAHSDTNMTEHYIKRREVPLSDVQLSLPPLAK